jgi:hypothetical protein
MTTIPLPALKVDHFSIAVRDLDASIQRYEDIFGLKLERQRSLSSPPKEPHRYEEHAETEPGNPKRPAFAAFIRDLDGTLIALYDPSAKGTAE